jgi:hypothetical protein
MRFATLIIASIFLAACSSKVTTSSTSASGKYSEDLTGLRKAEAAPADTSKVIKTPVTTDLRRDPTVYLEARHTVNQTLDTVLDSIDRINLANGVVEGFTIQLYSGVQRDEALDVRKQVSTMLPQLDADMQFVQPNFRVRAGKYLNRFDAQKDYMAVKKYFPNAIIIPERIPIR